MTNATNVTNATTVDDEVRTGAPTRSEAHGAPEAYARDGFLLVRGLFSREEAADWYAHAHRLGAERSAEFASAKEYDPTSPDPLRRHPRLMQPHLGDERSRQYLLDERLRRALVHLLGEEPLAVQTMIYFKPPGARGQALHQDQRFLQVSPGTCVAAWLALEPVDPANGCLRVVPGSHTVDVLCPVPSDPTRSFTSETVPVPDGMSIVDITMEPGDVLFFHGNLIHGSDPNSTQDRHRTVIVGHYATGGAEKISQHYPNVMSFAGQETPLDPVRAGGPCGEFVDGEFVVTSTVREALSRH